MSEAKIVLVSGNALLQKKDVAEETLATADMVVAEGDRLTLADDAEVLLEIRGELITLIPGMQFIVPSVTSVAALSEVQTAENAEIRFEQSAQENSADDMFSSLLEGDGDILDALEETAAGFEGGSGNDGGINVVRVERIEENLDPFTFSYSQSDDALTPEQSSVSAQSVAPPADEQLQSETVTIVAPAVTNDLTPFISGSSDAAPGSTILLTVTDAAQNIQTLVTIVSEDGTFGIEVPEPLAEGEYVVDGTVEGSQAQAVAVSGQIDITPPQLSVNGAGISNTASPQVTGTTDAPPGSVVTITVTDAQGNSQQITTLVSEDGQFEGQPDELLSEGSYVVIAEVSDSAGNSTQVSHAGEVDTVAPDITLNDTGMTNQVTPVISGVTTATPGSVVTITVTDSSGASQVVSATVQPDGSFAVQVEQSLSEGEFSLVASVTDEAGNSATVDSIGVLDTVAPTLILDSPGPGNDPTPVVTGFSDAKPGNVVSLVITDSAGRSYNVDTVIGEDGTFSVTVPENLAEGTFTVEAAVTDGAGNTTLSSAGGTIDLTPPTITLSAPGQNGEDMPRFFGMSDAPPGSTVFITVTDAAGATQSLETTVAEDGSFSIQVAASLTEGEFTVVAQVSDAAGNTSTTSQSGEYSESRPSISLDAPGVTNDSTPVITGQTSAVAGSDVTIVVIQSDGSRQSMTTQVAANGTFSAPVNNALPEGSFVVDVFIEQVDGVTASKSVTGEIDTIAPLIQLDAPGSSNDAQPVLSGSTDMPPGTAVILQITDAFGNTYEIETEVGSNGSFSATVPASLEPGEYSVTASVSDRAGNISQSQVTGEINLEGPSVSVVDMSDDQASVLLINTDAPGSSIVVQIKAQNGETQILSASADENGQARIEMSAPLSDGVYDINVSVTDTEGNQSQTSMTMAVDNTAPIITLEPLLTSNDETPEIRGSTDLPDGSLITLTVTDSQGKTTVFTAQVNDGVFSAQVPVTLAEGSYTVLAEATDSAGNIGTASVDSGSIDTTAPQLTLEMAPTTNEQRPLVQGSVDLPVGSFIQITVTDADGVTQTFTTEVGGDGSYSAEVTLPLSEGEYTVEVSATDPAGNTTLMSQTGTIDLSAPELSLDPVDSASDATPVIRGTTDEPAGKEVIITVTDASGNVQTLTATVDAQGRFSAEVSDALSEGEFTVSARVTDDAGNTSDAQVVATYTPQAFELNLNALSVTNDATPVISGSSNLPENTAVTLRITDSEGNVQSAQVFVGADGTFAMTVSDPLPEGAYEVTAEAVDSDGNAVIASEDGGVIDTTAPALSIDEQRAVSDSTPDISGTTNLPAQSVVSVTVTDSAGNIQTFTATVQSDGKYETTVPEPLAEGAYQVTVRAVDEAGNETSVTNSGGIVDLQPPLLTLEEPGVSNQSIPVLSGTTDVPSGSIVDLIVTDSAGNQQTLEAVVDGDGLFSVQVSQALAEGEFTVLARVQDEAGNETQVTDVTGEVDITPPVIELDALSSGNDTTPQVTGTTDLPGGATLIVEFEDAAGNQQTVTVTVSADGRFTVTPENALSDGGFTVSVSGTDSAGNTTGATADGIINTSAPDIGLISQTTGNDTTPAVSGFTTATPGTSVSITITDEAGNVQFGTATVQPDGTFTMEPDTALSEGRYVVEATVTDSEGNSATAVDANGVIDTISPTLSLNTIADSNDATPVISGVTDAPPASVVMLTITDAEGFIQTLLVPVENDGTFSAQVSDPLAEGEFTVEADLSDEAGNTATDTITGMLDVTPPAISLDAPGVSSDTTPTISGTSDAEPGTEVNLTVTDAQGSVFALSATVASDNTFTAEIPEALAEGAYSVSATVQDAAGNSALASTSGEVDTTAPVITVSVAEQTNDTTPLISGTSDAPAGSQVQIKIVDSNGVNQSMTAIVQNDGTYSSEPELALSEGTFTVSVAISDEAGNEATDTAQGTVDTISPLLTIDPMEVSNDTTPTISGSTDASIGTIVLITVTSSAGIEQTLSALVQADGSWSADVPLPVAEGEFSVTAQVFDEAGNVISVSANAEVDTTAPIITIDQSGIINVATPQISGEVDLEEGSQVIVSVTDANGETQWLTAIVDSLGAFSVTVPEPLAEGLITIQVDATDPAGNSSVSTQVLELDLTAATISLDIAPVIASDTPVISGVTDAALGAPVTIVVSQHGEVVATINTQVLADGLFSGTVPVALEEGTVDIQVTVNDGVPSTLSTTFEIDLTPPSLTLDPIGLTNEAAPVLSGNCDEPGAIITVTVTDSASAAHTLTVTVQPDGTFAVSLPASLPEGNLTISAQVLDTAGNETVVDISATIDTTAPDLTLAPVSFDSLTPLVAGTSEAGATITVTYTDCYGNDTTVVSVVAPDGTYSITPPGDLPQGTVSITVAVTDEAGNSTTLTSDGIIDVTLPLIALDALTLDTLQPVITGQSERIGETVTVLLTDGEGATISVTTLVGNDGIFSITVPQPLAEGLVVVSASVTDSEGNTVTDTLNGILDLTLPSLSLDALILDSLTPTISGVSELIGQTITLTVTDGAGGVQVLSTVVQNNGNFSLNVPADLSQGLLTVEASVLDGEGNPLTVSTTGILDISLPLLSVDALDGSTLTPVITGTSERIGSVVELTLTDALGGITVLNGLVQNDGTFSIPVSDALPQGLLQIEAAILDAQGNLVTVEVAGIINVSLEELSAELLNLDSASPSLTGQSYYIGETVSVTATDVNGLSQTLTAIVANDGSYHIDFTESFSDGLLTLDVSVLDSSSSTLASLSTTGVVDVSLPELSLNTLSFETATPVITGVSQFVGDTISITLVDIHGNTQTLDTVVQNDGNFQLNFTEVFSDGLLLVDVTVIDSADGTTTLASVSTSGVISVNLSVLELGNIEGSSTSPVIYGTSDRIGETVTVNLRDAEGAEQTLSATVQNDGTFSVIPALPVALGLLTVDASVPDSSGATVSVSASPFINVAPDIQVTSFDTSGDGAIFGTVSPEYAGYELTISLNVELLGAADLPISAQTALVQSDGSYEIIGVGLDANALGLPILSVDISVSMLDAAGNLVTLNTTSDPDGNLTTQTSDVSLTDTVTLLSVEEGDSDVISLPDDDALATLAASSQSSDFNSETVTEDVTEMNSSTTLSDLTFDSTLYLDSGDTSTIDALLAVTSESESAPPPQEQPARSIPREWESGAVTITSDSSGFVTGGAAVLDY